MSTRSACICTVSPQKNLLGNQVSGADAEASGRSGLSHQEGISTVLREPLSDKALEKAFSNRDVDARYQRLLIRRTGGSPAAIRQDDLRLRGISTRYRASHEPTPAQIASGNYPKRTLRWNSLVLRIENEAGSVRVASNLAARRGKRAWSSPMATSSGPKGQMPRGVIAAKPI